MASPLDRAHSQVRLVCA